MPMSVLSLFEPSGLPRDPRQAQPRDGGYDEGLFAQIAEQLRTRGFSVNPAAVPLDVVLPLQQHVLGMEAEKFSAAGIGRGRKHTHSPFVRTDAICWIDGNSAAGRAWLNWVQALQLYLNKQLLLGLFSFESHFSHYAPGDYYKRHKDAFKGEANRVLSLVLYLNSAWQQDDGGELVLYAPEDERPGALASCGIDDGGLKVTPLLGTLAIFLSEDFPHEVLPAARDRYAIAGWYRVNASRGERVDPPR